MTANQFTKGINQDIHPKFQEEGTYRFALNAVLETEEGEYPSISNELGNVLCETLPENKVIIGHTLTDNEDIVLALYDPNGNHEVGIFNTLTCTYSSLAIDSCLNFSDKYPVSMLFRIRNGCERVVNITDNHSVYKVLNLTDTSYWLDGSDIIDCNRIKFSKDYSFPCINLFSGEGDIGISDSQGSLKDGTYYFPFRYLDSELNATDFFLITRPVAICDEPFTNTQQITTVNLYDGGSNVEDSPYFVNPSNKSIKLQLSLLDNSTFKYFQFAVIKRTGDSGEIESVDLLTPTPITATSSVFTYNGLDSQIVDQLSLEEVLATTVKVETVKSQADLDNRLYLSGVSTSSYDWSLFQRYASLIKTEWSKATSNSPVDTFVRQGRYYFGVGSFMEDEIVPFGIIYVMEDGTISPVFHIPGRAPDTVTGSNPIIGTSGTATDGQPWDTGTTTLYGNTLFGKTKRWQQISTATKISANNLRGLMGYHEVATATYEAKTSCDGEDYWGVDWQGNALNGNKIRHHRMPDAQMYQSSFSTPPIHRVGVIFSNVTYPPGAVKHFFVYGDRTFERTILAKGALIPLPTVSEFVDNAVYAGDPPFGDGGFFEMLLDNDNDLVFAPQILRPTEVPLTSSPQNMSTYAFICTDGILKDKDFSPSFFHLDRFLTDTEYGLGLGNNRAVDVPDIPKYNTTLSVQSDLWHFNSATYPTTKLNYAIQSITKIPKAEYGSKFGTTMLVPTTNSTLQNLSFNISPIIVTLQDQITEWEDAGTTPPDQILFGSLKVDVDVFSNLSNITYKRMGNCPSKATSPSNAFQSFSGDTFISRLNITDYSYQQSEEDGKTTEMFHMAFPTADTLINYEMRHGATDPKYSYFQWNYEYTNGGHKQATSHMVSKYYEEADDIMELYPQNFDYNDSYSYIQTIEDYYPLPFNYEFCKDCENVFPHRIYYSELDNSEDSLDYYRIIRPNNYRDIDATTGPITDIFVNFNQLYARTTNSIFFLPTRPQTLQSDESSIYIGTGEVLSLPAQQLKTSENAFGGGNFFKSRTTTEYGTVYVDDISGRVFLLTNQLNDLSTKGLRNFFQNNGSVSFLSQFYSQTESYFPFFSTSSPSGVGYISWYDPRYKRLFIHKRDYTLKSKYFLTYVPASTDEVPVTLDNFEVRFNGHSFYTNLPTPTLITFNSEFFENKSFTLSYSFLTNHWISFHSYLPQYAFGSHTNFYTSSNSIYRHDSREYTVFNDIKYPHIIDIIAINNPLTALQTASVIYTSNTSYYDDTTKTYTKVPETFTSYIAYNTNQSSGKVDLILKNTPFQTDYSNVEALVNITDKQYRINDFRSKTINEGSPIWDSSWNGISTNYFIDKVPYESNIDLSASLFESKRFRDHYLGLRLFFESPLNAKITTDLISTNIANRSR